MEHIGKLVESMGKKMLTYAHSGIKEWQKIEEQEKYKQLQLKI